MINMQQMLKQFYKRTGDSKYIKSLNKIINQKAKEFGKPRVILDIKGKVVRRPTKFSLMKPDLHLMLNPH